MLTVLPCYAAADACAAAELAAFLRQGANIQVFLEDGEIRPPDDIVSKVARDGGLAEAVLLLFSPDSQPGKWDHRKWEPAFRTQPAKVGTRVAALLLRECHIPGLLKRAVFFDLTANRLAGFRKVKRWLMGLRAPAARTGFRPARHEAPEEALEALAVRLADRPGKEEVDAPETALAFAGRHAGEFEAVLWLNACGRGTAALAGDLGEQLGLTLPGPLEEDLERLRRCCEERRCLYLVAGSGALPDVFGPFASVLRIASAARAMPPGLAERERLLLEAFSACAPGADPELAARVAGLTAGAATAAPAGLAARGLVVLYQDDPPRYTLSCPAAPSAEMARRHAALAEDLAGVRHAWQWAQTCDWDLARDLGRRAMRLAVNSGRDAEAFELAEALEREAEPRGDRKVLEDAAWERAWILERWGRTGEAAALHRRRELLYTDQMVLDFGLPGLIN